ncbi:hypothetical protein K1719_028247 [Acacia pycnantha]|nr:hypothetical protein K1719_028247 [Acacia pycnantha]
MKVSSIFSTHHRFLKTTKILVKIWLRNFKTRWSKTYDIGSTIRDKIIPHALSWFTGETIQGEEFGDLEGDEDEDIVEED